MMHWISNGLPESLPGFIFKLIGFRVTNVVQVTFFMGLEEPWGRELLEFDGEVGLELEGINNAIITRKQGEIIPL